MPELNPSRTPSRGGESRFCPPPHPFLFVPSRFPLPRSKSSKQARPPTPHRLDLVDLNRPPPEPGRQLLPVEEQAPSRLHGAQALAARRADPAPVLRRAVAARGGEAGRQGPVLLGLLAVGGEGGGEGGRGGGGVRGGGVVDLCGRGSARGRGTGGGGGGGTYWSGRCACLGSGSWAGGAGRGRG